jgi:hypothetical protein
MENLEQQVYAYASPVNYQDIGICYYCGCESEHEDYAPPKDYTAFYLTTGENCSLAIMPCCKECFGLLANCRAGLLDDRKLYVNKCIERKYRKALNIYEKWDESELVELERTLAHSVKAGINLGEEAYKRLRYPGFEYEIEGSVFHARRRNVEIFSVFGERFDNFRNALQYASRSYKININTLKEWLMEHNTNFDNSINAYFNHQEEEVVRKKKKKLCDEFAKEHKQNSNFVKGALDAYMEANPSITIEECLALIYDERIRKV